MPARRPKKNRPTPARRVRLGRKHSAERIYQFKITLKYSKPPIWRRIQVADCTLDTCELPLLVKIATWSSPSSQPDRLSSMTPLDFSTSSARAVIFVSSSRISYLGASSMGHATVNQPVTSLPIVRESLAGFDVSFRVQPARSFS